MKKEFTRHYQIEKNVLSAVYKDCPYFPCHDLDEKNFSCMFCYCVYYDAKTQEGGCLSKHGNGKWHYYDKNGGKMKIWDCSSCTYPHEIENAIDIVKSFYITP